MRREYTQTPALIAACAKAHAKNGDPARRATIAASRSAFPPAILGKKLHIANLGKGFGRDAAKMSRGSETGQASAKGWSTVRESRK